MTAKNRIKELRLQNKLSQKELADKVGLSNQSISFYESGKREPKIEAWQKLAKFFNVSIPYLQGVTDFNILYDSKIISYFVNNIEVNDANDISDAVSKVVNEKLDSIQELVNQLVLVHTINLYLDNKIKGAKPIYKPITSKELSNIDYLKEHFNFLFTELSIKNKDVIIKNVLSGITAKKITNFKNNKTDDLFKEINNLYTIHNALENEINKALSKYPSKVFFDGAKDFILNKQFDDRTHNLTNDLFLTLMAVLARLDKRDGKK